ncbi:Aste57867_24301 [Aphanomyces stellatus]|uniref:Aste57867_24301 protein n=1 Tax=Aphanomyces stellatus TaxID=120398 RepID=A0A485LPZ9_9STRA|nr:hypothetical protein As57867_024226 [Aphanomyces stellatus]VFU00941.1 Aste57867_24301 [Aphanomyces stellatus]
MLLSSSKEGDDDDDAWMEHLNVSITVCMLALVVCYHIYTLHLHKAPNHLPVLKSPPIKCVAQQFTDWLHESSPVSREWVVLDQVIDSLLLDRERMDAAAPPPSPVYDVALMGCVVAWQLSTRLNSVRSFFKL